MSRKNDCLFVFDYETSIIHLSGCFQLVSVFVHGDRDFDVVDVDLRAYINISNLPHLDQAAIHQQIAAGLEKHTYRRSYSARELINREAREIQELNLIRGGR